MISHHPAKFGGGHRHCGRGVKFLVAEELDSTCSCLKPPLLFISKRDDGLKARRVSYS